MFGTSSKPCLDNKHSLILRMLLECWKSAWGIIVNACDELFNYDRPDLSVVYNKKRLINKNNNTDVVALRPQWMATLCDRMGAASKTAP